MSNGKSALKWLGKGGGNGERSFANEKQARRAAERLSRLGGCTEIYLFGSDGVVIERLDLGV